MASYDYGKKMDIQLEKARMHERSLGRLLEMDTVELKTETTQWRQTGNIFIEYECHGKPSGLAVTEAKHWVHQLNADDGTPLCYIVVEMGLMRELCKRAWKADKKNRKDRSGDYKASKGVVLPVNLARWIL